MAKVKGGTVNWPQTKEGMQKVQDIFTMGLVKIITETMSLKQIDQIIDGVKKANW